MLELRSSEECKKFVQEKGRMYVILFSAAWSETCKEVGQVFFELQNESWTKSLKFAVIEAECAEDYSKEHNVRSVPTILFIQDGKVVDRVDGAKVADVSKKVKLYSVTPGPHHGMSGDGDENGLPEEDLNERLRKLINRSPCMLFMKGNPGEPRCGFSSRVVGILKEHNVEFDSFDILQDEKVRQGLKEYSNWPTYPQLYLKGELIGGIDVIEELVKDASFIQTLPTKQPLEDRLKNLINAAPVMVFMKGTPDAPKCGFTRTLVDILKEMEIDYKSFDILTDQSVREGLKSYSNWPTYPQVYVKGDLVGGLDIIKELKSTGELKDALRV